MPMNMRLEFASIRLLALSRCATLLLLVGMVCSLSACQKDVVYQRSMSELNQKAQAMMQAGDYAGAIARLESAHDLQPDEPNTTYNLAVAYQMQGQYDKAISMFTLLLEKPGPLSKPEIQKALGITYEAKADKLSADAKEVQETSKSSSVKAPQLEQDAAQSYKMAMSYYQQAVQGGVKNAAELQKQVTALDSKLNHSASLATP